MSNGGGPIFIEAQTYRFRGHSIADPAAYRLSSEVEEWLARDPLDSYRQKLMDEGVADESELAEIDAANLKAIEDAVDFAVASPFPDPSELFTDIYGS